MHKELHSNPKPLLVLLIILPFICGCPSSSLLYPTQLGPDKFALDKNWDNKKITCVKVLSSTKSKDKQSKLALPAIFSRNNQWEEPVSEDFKKDFPIVWQLRAKRDIFAKDFVLTIGEVPEGFEQTIPSPTGKFYPSPETQYFVITLIEPADDSMIAIGKPWFPPFVREPKSLISDADPYIHKQSGMKFPMMINNFKRTQITFYDDTGDDMSVGYLSGNDEPEKTVMTVYLYPPRSATGDKTKTLEQGFEEMVLSIAAFFQNNIKNVSQKNIEIKQNGKTFEGKAMFFERDVLTGQKKLMSRAYLFLYKNHFIKYRITYPKENHNAADSEIEDFVKSLQWFDAWN